VDNLNKKINNCFISVNIQKDDFDVNAEIQSIRSRKIIGGIINFIGVVRDTQKEKEELVSLELEHYPGMTEKAIMSICRDAQKKWEINFVRVIHRVGNLKTGDNIVLVITASAHRKESFKSAEFIMDFLKSRAPIWKKEHYKTHSSWVQSKEADELLLKDW
tara:strand:+ start:476 stop:958 length:483 start_codon:yes stop_codon:yes gene_type:complete